MKTELSIGIVILTVNNGVSANHMFQRTSLLLKRFFYPDASFAAVDFQLICIFDVDDHVCVCLKYFREGIKYYLLENICLLQCPIQYFCQIFASRQLVSFMIEILCFAESISGEDTIHVLKNK